MLILPLLLQSAAPDVGNITPIPQCVAAFGAPAVVRKMSALPEEIRADLKQRLPDIVEPDQYLQKTDVGVKGKLGPFHRFSFAVLVKNEWFVSYENGGLYNQMVIGYVRPGSSPTYQVWPSHYFGGSPCAAIKAALAGVTSGGALGS